MIFLVTVKIETIKNEVKTTKEKTFFCMKKEEIEKEVGKMILDLVEKKESRVFKISVESI